MARDRNLETPVVLSRIYTRTGDDGTTALGDGSRVAKSDLRLAAYADVDEANCAIGAAVTMGGLPEDLASYPFIGHARPWAGHPRGWPGRARP